MMIFHFLSFKSTTKLLIRPKTVWGLRYITIYDIKWLSKIKAIITQKKKEISTLLFFHRVAINLMNKLVHKLVFVFALHFVYLFWAKRFTPYQKTNYTQPYSLDAKQKIGSKRTIPPSKYINWDAKCIYIARKRVPSTHQILIKNFSTGNENLIGAS